MNPKIYDLLCCPVTGEQLSLKNNELLWLFKKPEQALLEQAFKTQTYFKLEENQLNEEK